MDHENRVVVLIDMDCFYCQVEEKLNPELKGKPIAVVQYNPWKGGGIIAVNYVARSAGVTRHMRGDEAKAKCPDIQLPAVPCRRGKADITKYRDAGKDVAKVLQKFTPLLERASIDEAYLDITAAVQTRLATLSVQTVSCDMMPNTFALGYGGMEEFLSEVHACASDSVDFDYDHAKRLLVGAVIASEIRAAVFEQTGYRCSAGIAHNKVLAKLVCGMHKPDKQTVLPKHSVDALYRTLSVKKVKHLGGKFGDAVCGALGINTMAELQSFSEKELQAKFDEKNGTWLYNIARGTDLEPVQARFNPKSIGCCKQFRGKTALNDLDSLKKWLKDLGDEIEDRLEKDALENNRTPKQMVVSFSVQADGRDAASSRSYNFAPEDDLCGATFTNRALALVLESAGGCKSKNRATNRRLNAPIKFLGISVGKFEDNNENKKTKRINEYFVAGSSRETTRPPKDKMNTKRTNSEDNNYTFNTLSSGAKVELPSHNRKEHCAKENIDVTEVKEATLDGRESFFAKYLNTRDNPDENRTRDLLVGGGASGTEAQPFIAGVSRCATPQCNGVPCGDDSNDTNYSSSTINEEINKSIALFEEDPDDIVRVSSMRQLLNNNSENLQNGEIHDGGEDLKGEPEPTRVSPPVKPAPQLTDAVFCSECGKSISVTKLEEHADYHFALKLREEERKEVRKDRESSAAKDRESSAAKDRESSAAKGLDGKETHARRKKPEELANKTETATSITNYLIKIDSRVPTSTCAACGLNVAADRFAEHRDFHEAQKLSREWNSRPSHTSGKRKRRTSACPAKGPKMQCRPIDQFFR